MLPVDLSIKDRITMHTLDLDEHKEQERENARRTLTKKVCIDDFRYVHHREYKEYIKYIFKALPDGMGYIWFSLLYI